MKVKIKTKQNQNKSTTSDIKMNDIQKFRIGRKRN